MYIKQKQKKEGYSSNLRISRKVCATEKRYGICTTITSHLHPSTSVSSLQHHPTADMYIFVCHCLCVCVLLFRPAHTRTAGYASTACSASLPVNKPKMQTQLHDASSINTKTAANGGTRGSKKIYKKLLRETKQIVKYMIYE